ncbi:MAG: ABC transporter permease, partial [Acidobacteria bacterium]|nr:ABC transporter permease [Acidobacteriota bacterium]
MATVLRDLTYALRKFRSARVFTATAILTLALGIGGTTAIFTLIHAVMLKSLPVGDPARLYRVGDGDSCCVQGGPQDRWGMVSFPLYERLAAELPEFESLTTFQAGMGRMSVRRQGVDEAPRPLRTTYVSGSYFTTLGIGAFAGRAFTTDDDTPAAAPVVMMAYHAWQSQYGGDPAIIGGTLVVEGRPMTVSGVAPPGFFGETLKADPPDL